jgi:hypothetical protein
VRTVPVAFAILALFAADGATAATPTAPYHLAATRACLVNSHVRLVPDRSPIPYPELVGELAWKIDASGGNVFIAFARDPAHGVRLQQRLKQLAFGFGASPREIQKGLLRSGNVVYYANTFTGMTASRIATIRRCLR